MARKPKPKWDDPEESRRFIETAKQVEASEDPAEFEQALKRIASRQSKPRQSR